MAELSALERLGFLIEIPQPLHGTQLRERSESAKEKADSTAAATATANTTVSNTTVDLSDSNRGHDGVPPQQGEQQGGDSGGDELEQLQSQQQQRDVQYRFAHGFLPALLQVGTLLLSATSPVLVLLVLFVSSLVYMMLALHSCCACFQLWCSLLCWRDVMLR
jgi:hypothetical protein